jgi:5-dehydro-4-deoxyglucarate dehydratase
VSSLPTFAPDELAARLSSGLLSFPVTLFDDDLQFDEHRYREHLAWQASFDVAGLFAAGGTGEGFSLTALETDRVVRAAVDDMLTPRSSNTNTRSSSVRPGHGVKLSGSWNS